MDVRSIEDVEPVVEHNGTVPVWWLVQPREMFDLTAGGHLELVSEFEVAGGGGIVADVDLAERDAVGSEAALRPAAPRAGGGGTQSGMV